MPETTPAHTQSVTLHITESYPAHEPRESDPHYSFFNRARNRLKKLGKLKCWICGTDKSIQLHHDKIEFALANGVDIAKFCEAFPEFGEMDEETFLKFVEGEGNLTPLCQLHHTGILGVHVLPYPVWLPQKFWRSDLPAPASLIR